MFCIITKQNHSYNGRSWEKGFTGEDAKQLMLDAALHCGRVSGNLGFNGTVGYPIVNGVIFDEVGQRDAFLNAFGDKYHAKTTDIILKEGIDRTDIDF